MNLKKAFILIIVSSSTIIANPIVITIAKKVGKKVVKKATPKVATLFAVIAELGAEEIKDDKTISKKKSDSNQTMSKKDLDLYKTKF